MKQSIKTLEKHQSWRRGNDSPQGNPDEIGMAIDDCLQAAKRYELVRTLNPREFKQLWARNIKHGEGFDGLVDDLIKARAR
jgi:hypothetical protein